MQNNVAGVNTNHFVCASSAAMTYAQRCRIVLQRVEKKEVVLQAVEVSDAMLTICMLLPGKYPE